MRAIHVAGTADTKGEELGFLRDLITATGNPVRIVDLGTRAPAVAPDVTAAEVAACHPDGDDPLSSNDRGAAVAGMGAAFAEWCRAHAGQIAGIVAVGGGGGTSIACAGMRELPYGVPKIMVSTLASGDTAPYVGTSDIAMWPAVTDVAGLNRLSRMILTNAAHALVGAVAAPAPAAAAADRPAIGLTMFGVTTPCVTRIVERLRDRYDCLVFHATGTGGRAMERLLAQGLLSGLIDITTTEIADLLGGGVLPARADRLDAVARTRAPWVGSVGALDMVNFWAPPTVPEKYRKRLFYHHNPNVTLMRTTGGEMAEAGRWIAEKLNACRGPVRLLVPENGVSALDIQGGPFWNPDADAALHDALRRTIADPARLVFLPLHINDPAFADAAADAFLELTEPR